MSSLSPLLKSAVPSEIRSSPKSSRISWIAPYVRVRSPFEPCRSSVSPEQAELCVVHQPSPTITNHHQPHPSDSESTKNQPYEFECRVNRLRECQASLRSPRRQRLAVRSRHPARRELTSAERAVPLITRTVTPETRRRRESSSQVSHFSQIPFTPLYQPFSSDPF